MKVQEKIKNDLKVAMKNGNKEEVNLLRVVIGEFNRIGKDLTDEQVLKVITKMAKNARDLNNMGEFAILDHYIPNTLSEENTKVLISDIIKTNGYSGMKDMGNVMKQLRRPDVDMKLASDLVKRALA
jgi:uncharacterized protein YqeY